MYTCAHTHIHARARTHARTHATLPHLWLAALWNLHTHTNCVFLVHIDHKACLSKQVFNCYIYIAQRSIEGWLPFNCFDLIVAAFMPWLISRLFSRVRLALVSNTFWVFPLYMSLIRWSFLKKYAKLVSTGDTPEIHQIVADWLALALVLR